MYGEIPYKFKYMLNKIINCMMENILKYLSNRLLVESKLLLINNYIIDVFSSAEISKNNINNNINPSSSFNNSINKSFSKKIIFPKYDKNVTCSKLSNIFLNIAEKDSVENNQINLKEKNNVNIFPYKDKYKINKLKILLKNEQEKSMMKELSYLKRLSFIQKKLEFYESLKNNNEKSKNISEINNKNNSFKLNEEHLLKSRINNNCSDNLDFFTVVNSCKNRGINPFKRDIMQNNLKMMNHSMSHRKLISINLKKKV